jgi:hypothetical protein
METPALLRRIRNLRFRHWKTKEKADPRGHPVLEEKVALSRPTLPIFRYSGSLFANVL